MLKKVLVAVMAIIAGYYAYEQAPPNAGKSHESAIASARLDSAIVERRTDYQVGGRGTVIRLLPDDNDGSRHQRFILELESGRTLLVAHNIDVAPRIDGLRTGELVSFFGEYEWNDRGGVIHWTHHDPRSQHIGGWIEYHGKRYQ